MQNKLIILLLLAVVSICAYVGLTAREGRTPAPYPPPPFPVAEKDQEDAEPDDEGDEQAAANEPEKGHSPAPWLIAKKGGSIADTIPPPFPPSTDKKPLVGESPGLMASMPKYSLPEPKPTGPPVYVPGPKDGLPRIFEGPLAQAAAQSPPPVMIEPDAPPPSFPPVDPKSPPAPVETPAPLPPNMPPVPEKKKEPSVPAPEATPIAPPTSEPVAPPKAPDGPPVTAPKPPVPVAPKAAPMAPPRVDPVVPPPASPEVVPIAPPKTEVPAARNEPPLPIVPPPVVPEPAPVASPTVDAKVEIPAVPKSDPAVPVVPSPVVPSPVVPEPAPVAPSRVEPKVEIPKSEPVVPVAPPPPMVEVPIPKTVTPEPAPVVPPRVVETPPPSEPMRNKIAFPPIPAIPEPAAPAAVPDAKSEVPLPSAVVKPQIPTMPRYSRPGVTAGTPEPFETKKPEPAQAIPLVPMGEANIPAAEPKRPPAFRLVNPVRRSDPIPLPNERQFVFPGTNTTPTPMPPVAPAPKEKELDTGPPLPKIISQDPTERPRETTPPVVSDEPQTVPITVEKVGPMNMKAGELLSFEIVLRNPGSAVANLVRVEDEIPQGTRFLKADMTPIVSGGKLSWTVASIPAAGEKRLRVQLQAMANGSCVGATSVMITAPSVSARIPGQQPMLVDSARNLDVQVSGPAQVNVGQQVVWEVTIVNNGTMPASDMILHVAIPAGLKHPVAQNIEGDVGVLAPGAKKTIRVATTGASSGRHTVNVKITANNGQEVSAQATVNVGSVGLQINQSPSHRLILEKPNEIRIEILNFHSQTMRNISVIDTLPPEVEFISATELGLYRSSSRVVSWLIDQLDPGQSKVLVLQLKPKRAGTWNHEVVATAKPTFEARSQAALLVEGYADLNVKVVGRDPQLEVGKETVYQVRVINQGNVPATNIQLQALLPEGMQSGHAQGPTAFQGQGNQINFAPIGKLNPQAQVVYHIGVIAQSPGDRRFRVQVTSDQHQQPIAREERTVVYRD